MDIRSYLESKLDGKVSSKGWYNTLCLSPEHVDRRPSFGIKLDTGYGQCFSCGYKAHWLEIIALLEQSDVVTAAIAAKHITMEAHYAERTATVSRVRTKDHPYWTKRGLKRSTVFKWGLSYDDGFVMAPVHYPDGEFAGYVRRATDSKKYLNDPGIVKSDILVGYHMHTWPIRELYVAEGLIDTYVLDQQGLPVVGRLGWQLSHRQVALLRNTGARIVMVVDNDQLALEQTNRWIKLGFDVAYTELPHKDPSDMLMHQGNVTLNVYPNAVMALQGYG